MAPASSFGTSHDDPDDNQPASPWQRAVDEFLGPNIEEIYQLLVQASGCGPFDGACVLFAQALAARMEGNIWVLTRCDVAQHALFRPAGARWLVDAGGPADTAAMVERLDQSVGYLVGIDGCRPLRAGDLPESPRNLGQARRIARLLSAASIARCAQAQLSESAGTAWETEDAPGSSTGKEARRGARY